MGADGTQRRLGRLLSRRRHQVAAAALVALAVASVASMLVPKSYRSETRLEAQGDPNSEAVSRVASVREQILSSRTFDAVAADLGVVVAGTSPKDRAAAAEDLLRSTDLSADGSGEGRFQVTVSHSSADPDTCFRVVRRIADIYQEDLNERPRLDQEKVVAESKKADATAAAADETARKAHDEYRAANADLLDGTEDRLAKVRAEMRSLETTEISGLKAEVERLGGLLRDEQEMKKVTRRDVDRVRAAQSEQKLADAKAMLAAAADGSPEAKAAAAAVAAAEEEKKVIEAEAREVEEVVANPLHGEYRAKHLEATNSLGIAEIKLRELRKTERDLQGRSKQAVPVRAKLTELETAAAAAKKAHDDASSQLAGAQKRLGEIERAQKLAFTVVDPPVRPDSPAGPGPFLYALFGLVAGAGVGLGIAAGLDRADKSFREVDSAAETLGVPALGAIDRIVTPADAAADRSVRLKRAAGVGVLAAVALACAGIAVADGGASLAEAVRSVLR